jgi:hypothetical protein
MALGRRMTREPVRLKDAPGFLVNQVGRGYTLEGSHLVYEGVATFADVDRVMRDVGGFRMGPFELMDLTGLDVTQPASELIYNQFFQEPRYRPNLIMRSRYEAGVLGRKTKRGFYPYDGEMKPDVPKEAPAPVPHAGSVWVSPASPARRQGPHPGDAGRRGRHDLRGGAGARSEAHRGRGYALPDGQAPDHHGHPAHRPGLSRGRAWPARLGRRAGDRLP